MQTVQTAAHQLVGGQQFQRAAIFVLIRKSGDPAVAVGQIHCSGQRFAVPPQRRGSGEFYIDDVFEAQSDVFIPGEAVQQADEDRFAAELHHRIETFTFAGKGAESGFFADFTADVHDGFGIALQRHIDRAAFFSEHFLRRFKFGLRLGLFPHLDLFLRPDFREFGDGGF